MSALLILAGVAPGKYGANIIRNGTFISSSGWTTELGWSISGGQASKTTPGGGSLIWTFDSDLPIATYELTYTISNWTVGDGSNYVQPQLRRTAGSGILNGTSQTGNGTFTDTFTTTLEEQQLRFNPSALGDFKLDNVIFRRKYY